MPWELVIWCVSVVLFLALLTQWWWQPRAPFWLRKVRESPLRWYLVGFPLTVCRMRFTWRRLCQTTDLAITRRPRYTAVNREVMVKGTPLRPIPPRLGIPRVMHTGFTVRVHLHPGQTPAQFIACADAFVHAWRIHSIRIISTKRGEVFMIATARDPLADSATAAWRKFPAPRLMAAVVGRTADGSAWTMDFRKVPHWLITGATQSGKSTLLAALLTELGAQPVSIFGIDCKGGMELSLFEKRLGALATTRAEAISLLHEIVTDLERRMYVCRLAGVRSIWELPEGARPAPTVVVVDEIAELYLAGAELAGRKEAVECSTLLLRIAQLGAALGVHLVIAGQRFGSDLGPGATSLRAQLGGRICHRVNDEATAEMTLGDLSPDAVIVAQAITETEKGVAVTTIGGQWTRARSNLITPDQAREYSAANAHCAPAPAISATESSPDHGGPE
ncbi:FtsK/SpoIIIE domain-containing protein [Streptomyces sp. IB2014 016-6]|uniref:FtsK/SpoIIIE domain-containing protein n=1 Tax=Streptomyces sp. IB2014 016-6 TaxID=2517818 RepID=UPI0011C72326|nr:FtsK/SpoIIIE domain-containing protein [Streptomyces sp. IB2014 016-6]TXL88822.1 cell division protein FtsK [Streptomyces sp. IB2014 016-6]